MILNGQINISLSNFLTYQGSFCSVFNSLCVSYKLLMYIWINQSFKIMVNIYVFYYLCVSHKEWIYSHFCFILDYCTKYKWSKNLKYEYFIFDGMYIRNHERSRYRTQHFPSKEWRKHSREILNKKHIVRTKESTHRKGSIGKSSCSIIVTFHHVTHAHDVWFSVTTLSTGNLAWIFATRDAQWSQSEQVLF